MVFDWWRRAMSKITSIITLTEKAISGIEEYDKSQKWIINFNKITNQISNILLYLSYFNHWKCLQSKFYDAVTSGESSKIKLENKTFSKIVVEFEI